MVIGELDEETAPNGLGNLKSSQASATFRCAKKCVSLPWHTMHAALTNEGMTSTEYLWTELVPKLKRAPEITGALFALEWLLFR